MGVSGNSFSIKTTMAIILIKKILEHPDSSLYLQYKVKILKISLNIFTIWLVSTSLFSFSLNVLQWNQSSQVFSDPCATFTFKCMDSWTPGMLPSPHISIADILYIFSNYLKYHLLYVVFFISQNANNFSNTCY